MLLRMKVHHILVERRHLPTTNEPGHIARDFKITVGHPIPSSLPRPVNWGSNVCQYVFMIQTEQIFKGVI
uniref:Putative ovule protein n=1 Tax=Solanum chacoense TaxID=4108 RepID=A0A0V0H2Z2_SOLCH